MHRRGSAAGPGIVFAAFAAVLASCGSPSTVAVGVTTMPETLALPAAPSFGAPPPAPMPPLIPAMPLPPGTRAFSAAFTGDTLVHSPLWGQAERNAGGHGFDFTPMLAGLQPLLDSVDLAVCHLETPIAPAGEALSTSPLYGVPVEVAAAIGAAGYERCSTASNHTTDRGGGGIDRTVEALATAGVGQSGMARTPAEIEPQVFSVGGIALSHLSYTYSYNGNALPAGEEWRSALIDPGRIVADATEARRRGAEVIIVSLHWGAEGDRDPTAEQRSIAEQLTASGTIDLIVGHHAHVLQPIEQINGRWVVFGLGNILSNLPLDGSWWPASSQDGAVVTTRLSIAADGTVTVDQPVVHPTWVDRGDGWIVRSVQAELVAPLTPESRRVSLEASLARTNEVLGPFVAAPPP